MRLIPNYDRGRFFRQGFLALVVGATLSYVVGEDIGITWGILGVAWSVLGDMLTLLGIVFIFIGLVKGSREYGHKTGHLSLNRKSKGEKRAE